MHGVVAQLLAVVAVLAPLIAGGAVVPLVVSLITQSHWSAKVKQALLIALSGVIATVLYLNDNGWHLGSAAELLAAVIAVVMSAQATYHGLWKQSGITAAVSKLTDKKAEPAEPEVPEVPEVIASDVAHDDSDIAPVVAEDSDAEPRRAAVAPVAPEALPVADDAPALVEPATVKAAPFGPMFG